MGPLATCAEGTPSTPLHEYLLRHAGQPRLLSVQAFAGSILTFLQERPKHPLSFAGMPATSLQCWLRAEFGDAAEVVLEELELGDGLAAGDEDIHELFTLLMQHRGGSTPRHALMASVVATACLGRNHLWQDLRLKHRSALSQLLYAFFPDLTALNTQNMRWKKFFYKRLCEREGLNLCRAPSCGVCTDFHNCFGPETVESLAWVARA